MLNQHQTLKDNIEKFNKNNPLADYLVKFIEDKSDLVRILDVGSGPYSIIGDHLEGKNLYVQHCDNQDFSDFWKKYQATPVIPIELDNMEQLARPNEIYDLVTCINALDHTPNAQRAVEEMIRVCKKGGWVYLVLYLDQRSTGHKHFWDAKEDGVMVGDVSEFDLKDFGFKIQYEDSGMERRYSRIIATLQKI